MLVSHFPAAKEADVPKKFGFLHPPLVLSAGNVVKAVFLPALETFDKGILVIPSRPAGSALGLRDVLEAFGGFLEGVWHRFFAWGGRVISGF